MSVGLCSVGFEAGGKVTYLARLPPDEQGNPRGCSGSLKNWGTSFPEFPTKYLEPGEKDSVYLDGRGFLGDQADKPIQKVGFSIILDYQPWLLPWKRSAEFHFAYTRMPDGQYHQFSLPVR
jgi:hypothetical protein